MRIENHIEPERLRGLRDAQPRALRCRFDISGCANQLDGVGHGNRGNGRASAAGCFDGARDHRRGDERPCGVVDQNDIGLLARQRFQSGVHRGLARGAAIGGRCVAQAADGLVENRGIVGI